MICRQLCKRTPSRIKSNGTRSHLVKYSNGGCSGFWPDSLLIYSAWSFSNRFSDYIIIHKKSQGSTTRKMCGASWQSLIMPHFWMSPDGLSPLTTAAAYKSLIMYPNYVALAVSYPYSFDFPKSQPHFNFLFLFKLSFILFLMWLWFPNLSHVTFLSVPR